MPASLLSALDNSKKDAGKRAVACWLRGRCWVLGCLFWCVRFLLLSDTDTARGWRLVWALRVWVVSEGPGFLLLSGVWGGVAAEGAA